MQELFAAAQQDSAKTWLRLVQHTDPGIDRRDLNPYSGGLNWHVWEDALGAQMWCVNSDHWLRGEHGPVYWVAVRIVPDGNAWCATFVDFVNLQESPAGFGDTVSEAVSELGKARVAAEQTIQETT